MCVCVFVCVCPVPCTMCAEGCVCVCVCVCVSSSLVVVICGIFSQQYSPDRLSIWIVSALNFFLFSFFLKSTLQSDVYIVSVRLLRMCRFFCFFPQSTLHSDLQMVSVLNFVFQFFFCRQGSSSCVQGVVCPRGSSANENGICTSCPPAWTTPVGAHV